MKAAGGRDPAARRFVRVGVAGIALPALLVCGGCGLVLDPSRRDASIGLDAAPLDAPGLDAPPLDAPGLDAARPDAARPDAARPDAWLPDAPGLDAPFEDAFVEPDAPDPDPDAGGCNASNCRPEGDCDRAFCAGDVCQHERLGPGRECRPAADDCDRPEVCDGVSAACPADRLRGAEHVCRGDPNAPCDPEERCDGVSAACPADLVGVDHRRLCELDGGFCTTGGAPSVCVLPDECSLHLGEPCFAGCRSGLIGCDPGGVRCAATAVVPDGTICRPRTGPCDAEERCTMGGCPGDTFLGTATTCRPAAGPCDVEERCTTGTPTCPPDAVRGPTEVCLAGGCQLCTGEGPACEGPVRVAGTCAIGATSGVCAASGECLTGVGSCVLRDSPCLVGVYSPSMVCESVGVAPSMTPCGRPTQCTDAPMCNGSGECLPRVVLTGASCRAWCRGSGVVDGTCLDSGRCAPNRACP